MKKAFIAHLSVILISSITVFSWAQPPDTLWTKTYGGSYNDACHSVQQTRDGGYILAGYYGLFADVGGDVYLIKTDATGDTLWTKTYGGNGYDVGSDIQITQDGGYIIAGSTESFGAGDKDIYVLKIDAYGDSVWSQTFGGIGYESSSSICQTEDGGYIIVGTTDSYGFGNKDIWAINLNSNLSVFKGIEPYLQRKFIIRLAYPNPFNPTTNISFALPVTAQVKLNIYDISGSLVTTLVNGFRGSGSHEVTFDGSGLASGVYIYSLTAGEFTANGKMVLMK